MNLVISGPIDDTLRNMVVALSKPRRVVSLHARADRLEGSDDAPVIRTQVAALCDAARVDHAYIEEGVRFADFKLLAMDMDSTLITIECIDEIADFAGKKKEVASITEAAMRGEMDFGESLRRRVALLAGTPEVVLDQVLSQRLRLMPGAEKLIGKARKDKIHTMLLSGGFTYFSDYVKKTLQLDEAHANVIEISNGFLSGNLRGIVIDGLMKAMLVGRAMSELPCNSEQVIVIGDGANDIQMMKQSQFSIAFHAKPKTQNAALHAINFGGFDVMSDWFA